LRSLPRRRAIYREWGVEPAVMIYHGYGSGGHNARHVPLLRRTARRAGLKGKILAGEACASRGHQRRRRG